MERIKSAKAIQIPQRSSETFFPCVINFFSYKNMNFHLYMHTFPHSESASITSRDTDLFPPTMHCVGVLMEASLWLWLQWLGLVQPRTDWLFMCFILLNPWGFINIDWRQKMDGVQAQGINSISLTRPRPHTTGLMLHKLFWICFFFLPLFFQTCLSFLLLTFPVIFRRRVSLCKCVSRCITSVMSSGCVHITDKLSYLIRRTCNICCIWSVPFNREQIYNYVNWMIHDWSDLSLCTVLH